MLTVGDFAATGPRPFVLTLTGKVRWGRLDDVTSTFTVVAITLNWRDRGRRRLGLDGHGFNEDIVSFVDLLHLLFVV